MKPVRFKLSQRERRAQRQASEAWAAAQESARQHVGESDTARAVWLLRFAAMKLDGQPAPALRALGYQLRALSGWVAGGVQLTQLTLGASPMPEAELRDYQRQIAEGIARAFDKGSWALPPVMFAVAKTPSPPERVGIRLLAMLDPNAGEAPTILHGTAAALLAVRDRLRVCHDPQCRRVFVAVDRRARYCDKLHSMRVRNSQRRTRGGK